MIRPHKSQHEKVGELPLIARNAQVTAVEAMDCDRTEEIETRISQLADAHSFDVPIENGVIEWPALFDHAVSADRRLAAQIGAIRDRYQRESPALIRFKIEMDHPLEFAAGQYVSVRYGNRTRPYSVASSPNQDTLEICVRRVPTGRLSPRLCDALAVGDEVSIRGPNGDLLLEDPSSRDLVFLATGTGVAPLKSMIDYTFETGRDEFQGTDRDVWLFLGAAWKDDLPYHADFEERANTHDNFHYVPCLSRETWLSKWVGETEYIQDALMKYVDERALEDAVVGRHIAEMLADRPDVPIDTRIDPHDIEIYACGINAMVFSLEQAASRLGVDPHHIHCEGYG